MGDDTERLRMMLGALRDDMARPPDVEWTIPSTVWVLVMCAGAAFAAWSWVSEVN